VKFALIDAEKAHFPIAFMCRQLEVSRSGYYAWSERPPSARASKDVELGALVLDIHLESQKRYGSPRVHKQLLAEGVRVSRKRVRRLMRDKGLVARKKPRFVVTTDSKHELPTAPNVLARNFEQPELDRAWVTDITYLATAEGWLYLAVIIDLCSRRVVGWATSGSLERQLCIDALRSALQTRRPPPGLIHHSDRGTQYASADYRQMLQQHGIVCSMSRRGNCWDNAVAESFFSTLKTELIGDRVYATHDQARLAVFEYIEGFYNRKRLHSSIGYCSPADFEDRMRVA
jgi:transposase InsO family protein